jgi:hypothetical protein
MLATVDICSVPGLLTVEDALAVALGALRRVAQVETLPLSRAVGRVSAENVGAAISLPPFDQSAVDGCGLRFDDLATAASKPFRQAGAVFAGASQSVRPQSGDTVRLLTGAPIPDAIDAVVMEEKVRIVGSRIAFDRPAEAVSTFAGAARTSGPDRRSSNVARSSMHATSRSLPRRASQLSTSGAESRLESFRQAVNWSAWSAVGPASNPRQQRADVGGGTGKPCAASNFLGTLPRQSRTVGPAARADGAFLRSPDLFGRSFR